MISSEQDTNLAQAPPIPHRLGHRKPLWKPLGRFLVIVALFFLFGASKFVFHSAGHTTPIGQAIRSLFHCEISEWAAWALLGALVMLCGLFFFIKAGDI